MHLEVAFTTKGSWINCSDHKLLREALHGRKEDDCLQLKDKFLIPFKQEDLWYFFNAASGVEASEMVPRVHEQQSIY